MNCFYTEWSTKSLDKKYLVLKSALYVLHVSNMIIDISDHAAGPLKYFKYEANVSRYSALSILLINDIANN